MSVLRTLIQRLLPDKSAPPVLLLGLDNSGKTTLLYKLHLDQIVQTIPHIGTNVETITVNTFSKPRSNSYSRVCGNADTDPKTKGRPITTTIWDIGGGCGTHSYHMYMLKAFLDSGRPFGLIWVVDGADEGRLEESKEYLKAAVGLIELVHGGKGVPVLVLVSKRDLSKTIPLSKIIVQFAPVLAGRTFNIYDISCYGEYRSSGIPEALEWFREPLCNSTIEPQTIKPLTDSFAGTTEPSTLEQKVSAWVSRAEEDSSPSEFFAQFEEITLPAWDHYTHIRIAFLILTTFGRQKGKDLIFQGIEKYISNSSQTRGRTFHVTMTYFWIQIVHFGIQSLSPMLTTADPSASTSALTLVQGNYPLLSEDFPRFLLLNPYVADGNLWAEYYTKECMMSPAAKTGMVLPDRRPLPNLVARDGVPLSQRNKIPRASTSIGS